MGGDRTNTHIPTGGMSGLERLQHIRNAITRLKYIGEKDRHLSQLEQAPGTQEITGILEAIREQLVPLLEFRQSRKKDGPGPQHNTVRREKAQLVLESVRAHLEQAQRCAADEASTEDYQGLQYHLLVEAEQQLTELVDLLDKSKPQESRINDDILNDSIAHHIDDFDTTVDLRIKRFIQEGIRERNFFSQACVDDDQMPIGMVSAMLLDCAVGVDSAGNVMIALEHLNKKLEFLTKEVYSARTILEKTPDSPDPIVMEREHNQIDAYREMEKVIGDVRQSATQIAADWAQAEEEAVISLERATSVDMLTMIAEAKRVRELQLTAQIQKIHALLTDACLPFLAPQYHRRHQLTYSSPCQIRIGMRFVNRAKSDDEAFVWIRTLNPLFAQTIKDLGVKENMHETLDYILPSKDQIWQQFDEFPEMIKGKRCALRNGNVKDYERACEEQREVGGYFMMRGGERILRALLMQRCNAPINIHREKFQDQGPYFSPNAVVFRSKRVSGLTAQNYFYYTTRGEVLFSFARKVVWHIPLPLLFFATKRDLTPMALFQELTLGFGTNADAHKARVESMLQHHRKAAYGSLTNMIDYLTVIGAMYRQYQQNSTTLRFIPGLSRDMQAHQDAWYGLFMMRRHVLPHLNCDAPTPDLPMTMDLGTKAWPGPEIEAELSAKFDCLVATVRQLYQFVDGKTGHQGNDVPAFQEIFTPSQVLVGAFEACVNKAMKMFVYRLGAHIIPKHYASFVALGDSDTTLGEGERQTIYTQLKKYVDNASTKGGTESLSVMHRLLTTGNFTLERDEDFYCPQNTGWVVMAEHLNFFRFYEQLRCLHRGKTIAEMRSSDVRKYPCEAYGFICMVHSPDGEDCGVLNHMSVSTVVTNSCLTGSSSHKKIMKWIRRETEGLIPLDAPVSDRLIGTVPLWVEGQLVGYVEESMAEYVAARFRRFKTIQEPKLLGILGIVPRKDVLPHHLLEVVLIPPGTTSTPALHLFYEAGRMMRPVQLLESSLKSNAAPFPLVYVGTWEQTYLDIAGVPTELIDAKRDLNGAKYEFMEQNGSNLISFTSTTIPFFEHNCSPRNLFQCGLSKQSAGTQLQALGWRKEAKLFRMFTPQRYLVRTLPMDYYGLDEVSLGVNATIAVLAYTGYDMDDAIIINQSSVDRGLFHASVTISKIVDLRGPKEADDGVQVFHNLANGARQFPELGENGLPPRRSPEANTRFTRDHKYPTLLDSTPVYSTARRFKRKDGTGEAYEYTKHHVTKWKFMDKGESAWVHNIIPLAYDGPDVVSALFVFRIPRNPCVGDKFSSRHGQKGTLPLHIQSADLPFSCRTGITPDVIINPNAFPSRMTVGMVLEIMGAKLGAVQGRFIDNSAWSTVDEDPVAAEEVGDALSKLGYNRHGREQMVCGMSGETMAADVFVGICGYQRLRHQVNDKWQSRARTDHHTHRAVTRTGQPVKGRKRHGGVRVGEMERDGLLSHGIADVVLDRLLHVSDKTKTFICSNCGGLLSIYEKHSSSHATYKVCKYCGESNSSNENIWLVDIPQVLRLWASELTSVGIRVSMKVKKQ